MYQKSVLKNYLTFFLFALLLKLIEVNGHIKNNKNVTWWNQIENHQKVIESWSKLNSTQIVDLDLLTSGLSSKLDYLVKYTPNITSKCSQSLINLRKDAQQMKRSAIKALDSWGKFPPSGLLHGTFGALGDYDMCIENDNFQYCTIYLRPLLPRRKPFENINTRIPILNKFISDKDRAISILADKSQLLYYVSLRIGICLPNDCSSNEINNFLQTVANNLELKGKLLNCETNEIYKNQMDSYAIVSIFGLSLLIFLSIVGIFVDDSSKEKRFDNNLFKKVLSAFSLKKNFNNLFKSDLNYKEFECINGIRVFTIIWIIFSHTYLWMNHHLFSNTFNIFKILNNFPLSGLLNGFFAVDTFFVISGILTSYITIKSTNGVYKNFNLFMFIISRYLRLTPGVIFSMFTFLLLPFLGSGPFFTEIIKDEVDNCRSHWLYNLIYLQTNILNEDTFSLCNMPTWWISIEMKLHLLSVIVVIYIFLKPKLSFVLSLFIIICSFIWAFIDHFYHGYPPFTVSTIPEVEEFMQFTSDFLQRTHIHIGPFFVGIYLGYLLANEKFKNISKKYKVIGWILTGTTILLLLYVPYIWVIGPFSRLSAAIYASVSQTIWALTLFYIIFACVNDFGGIVNTILSFRVFRPLARTIYMTYLVHGQVLILFNGTRNKLIPVEISNLSYILVGHIVFSFIFGFIMTLLVESPTQNLLKLLIRNLNKSHLPNDCNNNFLDKKNNEAENSLKLEEI